MGVLSPWHFLPPVPPSPSPSLSPPRPLLRFPSYPAAAASCTNSITWHDSFRITQRCMIWMKTNFTNISWNYFQLSQQVQVKLLFANSQLLKSACTSQWNYSVAGIRFRKTVLASLQTAWLKWHLLIKCHVPKASSIMSCLVLRVYNSVQQRCQTSFECSTDKRITKKPGSFQKMALCGQRRECFCSVE